MLKTTRIGARAEYMANYFLSHIGFTVPVPRQEDFGIDFYCSLSSETETRVFQGNPFVVQCKSGGIRKIEYGGKTKAKIWKKNEIDFLFQLRTPLILIHVDEVEQTIMLYPMTIFRFIQKEYPNCSKIVINYNINPGKSNHHTLKKENITKISKWNGIGGDGNKYSLDLQHPLISVPIHDLKNKNTMANIKKILSLYIDIEQRNIIQNELNWPTFNWPSSYTTNNENVEYKWIHYTDEPAISDPNLILEQNGQLLNALAISFKLHGKMNEFETMKTILKELPDAHKLKELEDNFQLYGS